MSNKKDMESSKPDEALSHEELLSREESLKLAASARNFKKLRQESVEDSTATKADQKEQKGYKIAELHQALRTNNISRMKELLGAKADINYQGLYDLTILAEAAAQGNIEAVKLLLDAKADTEIRYINGSMTQLLFHLVNFPGLERLEENLAILKLLLQAQADVNVALPNGNTAIHMVANSKNILAMKMLLEAKAEVNIRDFNGIPALHIATKKGSLPAVEMLLEAKASVNAKSFDKTTALHIAAERKSLPIIEKLLSEGANVHAGDIFGLTPLHLAAHMGNRSAVKKLLDAKASINQLEKYGLTPLHMAIYSGDLPTLRLLIDTKADIDAKTKEQKTPLSMAIAAEKLGVVTLLLDARADPAALLSRVSSKGLSGKIEGKTELPSQLSPEQQFADAIESYNNRGQALQLLEDYDELFTVDNMVLLFELSAPDVVCKAVRKRFIHESEKNKWQANYVAFLQKIQATLEQHSPEASNNGKLRRLRSAEKYLRGQIHGLQDKEKKQDVPDKLVSGGVDTEKLTSQRKQRLIVEIKEIHNDVKLQINKLRAKVKGPSSGKLKSILGTLEKEANGLLALSLLDCTEEKLKAYQSKLEKLQEKLENFRLPNKEQKQTPAHNSRRAAARPDRLRREQEQKTKQITRPEKAIEKPDGPSDDNLPTRAPSALSTNKKPADENKRDKPSLLEEKSSPAYKQRPIDQLYLALRHFIAWRLSWREEKSIGRKDLINQKLYHNLVGLRYLRDTLKSVRRCTQHNPTGFKIIGSDDYTNFDKLLRFFDWAFLLKDSQVSNGLIESTLKDCFAKGGLIDKLLYHLRLGNNPGCAWSEQQLRALYLAIRRQFPVFDPRAAIERTDNYLLSQTPLFKALASFSGKHINNDSLPLEHIKLMWAMLEDIVQFYRQQHLAIENFQEVYRVGVVIDDWNSISPNLPEIHILEQLSVMIQLCGGYTAQESHRIFFDFVQACRGYASVISHSKDIAQLDVDRLLSLCGMACKAYDQMSPPKVQQTGATPRSSAMTLLRRNLSAMTADSSSSGSTHRVTTTPLPWSVSRNQYAMGHHGFVSSMSSSPISAENGLTQDATDDVLTDDISTSEEDEEGASKTA